MIEQLNESAKQLMTKATSLLESSIPTIIKVAITLIAAYILIRITKGAIKRFFDKTQFDKNVELVIYNFSGYILWFITLTIIVGELGLTHIFASMLAVSALLGMAGALAMKDSVTNVISGIMLIADKDFNVGDEVEIFKINKSGKIKDIKLRTTKLDTEDGRIVIPNSIVTEGGWKKITKKK